MLRRGLRHISSLRSFSTTQQTLGPVRVRYAPSPTGEMHLGGIRTALYNFLLAKKTGGQFLLRIEDTDQTRLVPGSAERLARVLEWAGLPYDEGPDKDGGVGPYTQSQRLPLYQKHAHQLVEQGHAYRCFCSEQRLETMRKLQLRQGQKVAYDRFCTRLSPAQIQEKLDAKAPYTIRFKVPEGSTVVEDVVIGRVEFDNETINDQVLLKSDGFPTYHLACVVDDHYMKISHVIRGEEWLSSTPKHVQLYQSLGWKPPLFAHLPLLLNKDKQKLSKRHGDVTVEAFMAKGFLPEAVINFVALLGWSPGTDQDVFDMNQLIEAFSLDRITKGGAVVNNDKLIWLNAQHIRRRIQNDMPSFVKLIRPVVLKAFPHADVSDDFLRRLVLILQDRLHVLSDVVTYSQSFFVEPDFQTTTAFEAARKAWKPNSKPVIEGVLAKLEAIPESEFSNSQAITQALNQLIPEMGITQKDLFVPLRFVLTASSVGVPIHETLPVLGKKKSLERIQRALNEIEKMPK